MRRTTASARAPPRRQWTHHAPPERRQHRPAAARDPPAQRGEECRRRRAAGLDPPDAGRRAAPQRAVLLPLHGGGPGRPLRGHAQHVAAQPHGAHTQVQQRQAPLHGEALLLHDVKRELDVAAEDVVAGAQLHEELRAGLHRDRRADQALRLHLLLQQLALQLRQRCARSRAPGSVLRALGCCHRPRDLMTALDFRTYSCTTCCHSSL